MASLLVLQRFRFRKRKRPMAEEMPPQNDPHQNNQNLPPKKPTGEAPNWGVWIMMTLIASVLLIGFTSPGTLGFSPTHKENLAEFNQDYKNGLIVMNAPKEAPLSVLLSDSSSDGVILAYKYKEGTKHEVRQEPFTMVFNASLADDNFKQRLDELGVIQPSTKDIPVGKTTGNISTDKFDRLVAEGRIVGENGQAPRLYYDGATGILTGNILTRTWPKIGGENGAIVEKVEVPFNQSFDGRQVDRLLGNTVPKTVESSTWKTILSTFLPILLILGILFFMFRVQTGGGAKGAMSFGKSRAKLMSPDRNKVTFKDVAGVNEAKEEVGEIVDFLRDPAKFRNLGGNIPKGVLMVGSPGTGKTLLARAIAGEADVPFFSISGSDFVEMFVGVGASRVRDMFEQGKKSAPCIIFIDEIDAVGRHRGYGVGGGHDEREQTLNALLVEMDGFDGNENVIVIAATNRADVLDPALLRPGRFDRQVEVSLPDVKGREQILLVHTKKVKMVPEADFGPIARGTSGFSGAELANLINEAALLAARKGLKAVGNPELEEARDKVRWGRERRSLSISDKEKRITAVHEGGHAICLLKTEKSEPLHKVTIIPRGPALGSTMWLPAEDKYHMLRSEMLDSLVVAMGGRCAEQLIFNDVTSGAMGDISMATKMARRMVCSFGMSDKLGLIEYGDQSGEVFLARDLGTKSRNYSEKTAELIDSEVRDYVSQAYQRAKIILTENRDKLDLLTDALLEYETLDGTQVADILEQGWMNNPPEKIMPPPMPDDDDDVQTTGSPLDEKISTKTKEETSSSSSPEPSSSPTL
ncbi:MAG: ATP-dependent zinc metalloprotease FtsH [Akkermansia sp.]